jgi:hypothetical protein
MQTLFEAIETAVRAGDYAGLARLGRALPFGAFINYYGSGVGRLEFDTFHRGQLFSYMRHVIVKREPTVEMSASVTGPTQGAAETKAAMISALAAPCQTDGT